VIGWIFKMCNCFFNMSNLLLKWACLSYRNSRQFFLKLKQGTIELNLNNQLTFLLTCSRSTLIARSALCASRNSALQCWTSDCNFICSALDSASRASFLSISAFIVFIPSVSSWILFSAFLNCYNEYMKMISNLKILGTRYYRYCITIMQVTQLSNYCLVSLYIAL